MLPQIKTTSKKYIKSQSAFTGLDRTEPQKTGSLNDCLNVSPKFYPYISSRDLRYEKLKYTGIINDLSADNSLYYIYNDESGKYLNYNGKDIKISEANENISYCAQISDSIFIMPEKMLYRIEDDKMEPLSKSAYFDGDSALEKCKKEYPSGVTGFDTIMVGYADKNGIHSKVIGDPAIFYYVDFGTKFNVGEVLHIKMYVKPYPSDYSKEYYNLIDKFEKGIDLELKGITKTTHEISGNTITEYTSLLFEENAIAFDGYEELLIRNITIERKVPELKDVCAYNNRLWGITDHSIHTSKLGNAGEWNDFSQDSYGTLPDACFTCSVDTNSNFTAICSYNGNILAFKENCIHKVYGDQPDNYTLVTIDCPGVEDGAKNTLLTLNGALYYKGVNGIYEYTTGMPSLISKPLGNFSYKAKFAATDGISYYIALEKDNDTKLYCYNPVYKTWHIEDLYQNTEFLYGYENNIYIATDGKILTSDKSSSVYEDEVSWNFKMKFDENTYNRKCYTKLKLNYSLNARAYFYVYVYYDGELIKKYAFSDFTHDENGQAFVPLTHRGCKDITIVFSGKGEFKLKNITREFIILNEGGK